MILEFLQDLVSSYGALNLIHTLSVLLVILLLMRSVRASAQLRERGKLVEYLQQRLEEFESGDCDCSAVEARVRELREAYERTCSVYESEITFLRDRVEEAQ